MTENARKRQMDDIRNIWDQLYKKALGIQNERKVSDYVEADGVAAAIRIRAGNIYMGRGGWLHWEN